MGTAARRVGLRGEDQVSKWVGLGWAGLGLLGWDSGLGWAAVPTRGVTGPGRRGKSEPRPLTRWARTQCEAPGYQSPVILPLPPPITRETRGLCCREHLLFDLHEALWGQMGEIWGPCSEKYSEKYSGEVLGRERAPLLQVKAWRSWDEGP